ncbi:unnamed protein product [Cuscuta europaea]|uniref:Uncharacterized protein n=1 Tax=Cuscuta europaea TaxID=41803 RepID=A0A9P0ZIY4_CUSEU|nr:unnamed protein product [Cuscuta europaea]
MIHRKTNMEIVLGILVALGNAVVIICGVVAIIQKDQVGSVLRSTATSASLVAAIAFVCLGIYACCHRESDRPETKWSGLAQMYCLLACAFGIFGSIALLGVSPKNHNYGVIACVGLAFCFNLIFSILYFINAPNSSSS